jgi:ABC-2 type transport system permease protein
MEALGERGGLTGFEAEIVWQKYNPYRVYTQFPEEWVIVRPELETEHGPFNQEDPITSGLEEVLLPYPGGIADKRESTLEFTRLINTGAIAGTIKYDDLVSNQQSGVDLDAIRMKNRGNELILAAAIRGKAPDKSAEETMEVALDEADAEQAKSKTEPAEINVVYVADIDVLSTPFVTVRARPNAGEGVKYRFDNVTFVLNVIDRLAGETDFLDIRKRKTKHSTLKVIEIADEDARKKQFDERQEFNKQFDAARKKAEENRDKAYAELKKIVEEYNEKIESGDENIDREQFEANRQKLGERQAAEELKFQNEIERLERNRDKQIAEIQRGLERDVLDVQYKFKFYAVVIPWILPALVGLTVFVSRMLREREGITKARLR